MTDQPNDQKSEYADVEEVFAAIKAGDLLEVREIGHALVDQLPSRPWPLKTLSDLAYRAYVVRGITLGLRDAAAGRSVPQEEVERRFGLHAKEEE